MGERSRTETPVKDGHLPRRQGSLVGHRLGVAALGPALAGLSLAAALAMGIDDVPLALRVGFAGAVAAGVGVSVAILVQRPGRAPAPGDPDADPLTGLMTRAAFERAVASELVRAGDEDQSVALVVLDVDGFRALEQQLGRAAAQGALRLVARDLRKWKRRVDTAARLGGESFALLLPETDAQGALIVSERMRRASHGTFVELKAHVTLSLGVAAFPKHAREPEALMDAAHRALLAAKELGRDRSTVFSTEVDRVLGHGLAGGPGPGLRMAAVVALAEALDLRDTGSTTHSRTVGRCAFVTARELGLPPTRCERVRLAGVLHDIGMVAVPAEVVARKDGQLEDEEIAELHRHPEVAARLLAGPAFADLRDWIAAHHECYDGSGYPLGLSGEAIPIEAQILGAADLWEELIRTRGDEAARDALRACAGTGFDTAVVGALLRAVRAPTDARDVRHH